jgi:hypothetical protein
MSNSCKLFAMNISKAVCIVATTLALPCYSTTITVAPVYEPLSLHGTDGDDAIFEIGEALQATVMPRPMALSGAFPEVLVESMRTPHPLPTNNPNYQVKEANLFILCNIGVAAELTQEALVVSLDISDLQIPHEVDLTTRQILRIAIVALRHTLTEYQRPQPDPLNVKVRIVGATGDREPLRDAGLEFTLAGAIPND